MSVNLASLVTQFLERHGLANSTIRYSKVTSLRAQEVALHAFKKIPPFGQ